MSHVDNPYAALPGRAGEVSDPDALAERFTRLVAAVVDGALLFAVLAPIQMLSGFHERARSGQAGQLESLVMSLLAIGIMLGLHGRLLYTRGQTIGKVLMRIQIVDRDQGGRMPFFRVFVLRYLWLTPLGLLGILFPIIPLFNALLYLLVLVDALMIFGENRQCLHDLIAGSKVVQYEPDRQVTTGSFRLSK